MSQQGSRSPSPSLGGPSDPSSSEVSSGDESGDDLGVGFSASRPGSPTPGGGGDGFASELSLGTGIDELAAEEDTVQCRWGECEQAFTQLKGLIDHIHSGMF
jgi:hypothetical protein